MRYEYARHCYCGFPKVKASRKRMARIQEEAQLKSGNSSQTIVMDFRGTRRLFTEVLATDNLIFTCN